MFLTFSFYYRSITSHFIVLFANSVSFPTNISSHPFSANYSFFCLYFSICFASVKCPFAFLFLLHKFSECLQWKNCVCLTPSKVTSLIEIPDDEKFQSVLYLLSEISDKQVLIQHPQDDYEIYVKSKPQLILL